MRFAEFLFAPRAVALMLVLAPAWSLAHAAAPELEAEPPAAAAPKAWQWAGIYKADALHANTGSLNSWVGNLNLRADADAGQLFGWAGTSFHIEVLLNHGGKPNQLIGSTQGISNIEVAEGAARLYATWLEHEFAESGTRLLFGLYDLNSEFYATEASALLINPSFGIGIDASQSGRNGPSVFPNLGLTLRLRQAWGASHYVQAALIDGVPGDPAHPGRTVVKLSREDGALGVLEFGYQERGEDGSNGPGHWAVGAWQYSAQSPSRAHGSAGTARNHGIYALAQGLLHQGQGSTRTIGFVRSGLAHSKVNAVDWAVDTGLLIEHPLASVSGLANMAPQTFTAGLAYAHYGQGWRDAQLAAGTPISSHELVLEVGVRWQLLPTLAVQPLLQHLWHPGGRREASSTLIGARLEWSFGAP